MLLLCAGALCLAVSSCASATLTQPPLPRQTSPPKTEEPVITPKKPSPRVVASLQLTEQGRLLLERGNADDAIRMLERAINLNPTNGQNYFYLSGAWLMKGDLTHAAEFNRLAEIYLEEDTEWLYRIRQQRERIRKSE